MKFPRPRFNTYLLALLAALPLAGGAGCKSGGMMKKEASTLRFHFEVNADGTDHNSPVSVNRSEPFLVNVEKQTFLHEGDVAEAWVVEDELGSFAIALQFDRRGTWLLEQYTVSGKGRRAAIFSQFSDARWLAAPILNRNISDGRFVFTPDATRAEAERIVRGLNNVAKVTKKKKKQ